MTVAVVATAWNGYWEQFGARWLETVQSGQDPQPDEIILVTETLVPNLPGNIINITARPGFTMWNAAAEEAESEWVMLMGIDDLCLEHCFSDVASDADCISYPHLYGGSMQGIVKAWGDEYYKQMPYIDYNPMVGGFFHRAALLREIPYRDYQYCDEVHFCEMAWMGKTIEFTDRPRQIWWRWPGANGAVANPDAQAKANEFKRMLREGLVRARREEGL